MPAPAVIPAPRAYINAVAVKGFVVELWIVRTPESVLSQAEQGSHAGDPRTSETNITGTFLSVSRSMPAGRTPVFITVTKKVRPKQSIDMN